MSQTPSTFTEAKAAHDHKIVTQVAVEAVANNPEDYDWDTVELVRQAGKAAGVAALYMDMLPEQY